MKNIETILRNEGAEFQIEDHFDFYHITLHLLDTVGFITVDKAGYYQICAPNRRLSKRLVQILPAHTQAQNQMRLDDAKETLEFVNIKIQKARKENNEERLRNAERAERIARFKVVAFENAIKLHNSGLPDMTIAEVTEGALWAI